MNTDVIVYIGRFQPAHKAHIETISRATMLAEKRVIILIGSANQPRTTKNPWKWDERADMIYAALPENVRKKVTILPLRDTIYNENAWNQSVQEIINSVVDKNDVVKIIGYTKDETSYYIKSFPQWETIEIENIEDLHATDIRTAMFENEDFESKIGRYLPQGIHDYIKSYMLTPEYDKLIDEYKFQLSHERMWNMDKMLDCFVEQNPELMRDWGEDTGVAGQVIDTLRNGYRIAPYEPTFNTTDMIVVKSGHVLLVRRRAAPGKGLYAIPGGYLNNKEWSLDGALRELKEETKIKEPPAVLRSNVKANEVFEHPERSLRGRIITRAYIIELPAGELPKVKGSDDAEKAKWIPLSVFEKMEDQMFEDHYHIIKSMIAKLPKDGN